VQDSGLLFYYNPYEIAPYAVGPTELLLTYEALEPIMDKEGCLKSIIR
jgi:hypothetical protein